MPTNCQSKCKYQSAINVNRRDVTRFGFTKVDVKRNDVTSSDVGRYDVKNSDVTKVIRNNRDVEFSYAPTMNLYGLKPTNESASNVVTWGSWPIEHRPLVCSRPNERSVETMLRGLYPTISKRSCLVLENIYMAKLHTVHRVRAYNRNKLSFQRNPARNKNIYYNANVHTVLAYIALQADIAVNVRWKQRFVSDVIKAILPCTVLYSTI